MEPPFNLQRAQLAPYIEKPRTSQAKIKKSDLTKKNKTKNVTETRIRIEHTVTCDIQWT